MRRILYIVLAALACSVIACGAPSTPDTEGETLQSAQQQLRDFGVPANKISVVDLAGQAVDPSTAAQWEVCDHDPDGVAKDVATVLTVAGPPEGCPVEEKSSSDKKKKKRFKRR